MLCMIPAMQRHARSTIDIGLLTKFIMGLNWSRMTKTRNIRDRIMTTWEIIRNARFISVHLTNQDGITGCTPAAGRIIDNLILPYHDGGIAAIQVIGCFAAHVFKQL